MRQEQKTKKESWKQIIYKKILQVGYGLKIKLNKIRKNNFNDPTDNMWKLLKWIKKKQKTNQC